MWTSRHCQPALPEADEGWAWPGDHVITRHLRAIIAMAAGRREVAQHLQLARAVLLDDRPVGLDQVLARYALARWSDTSFEPDIDVRKQEWIVATAARRARGGH